MGDGYQLLTIVLFAVIAGVLVVRLRSVLGRRTGNERPPRSSIRPTPEPAPEPAAEKIVPLPGVSRSVPVATLAGSASVTAAASRLKAADPSFDEAAFLRGARAAFEIVVNAFAAGDTATLQPLLSPAVYASFAEAIRQRIAAHEKLETTLLSIKATETEAAEIEGNTALVTVKFISDQIHVLRGADGAVIEGNPDQVLEKTDLWTFSRPLRTRNPNWMLVATHSS
jgi:predicted lipid-binding transport protein (Tim44 family)